MIIWPIISHRSTTTDPQRSVKTPSKNTETNWTPAVSAVSTTMSGCPQCSDATTPAGCRSNIDWCQMIDATV